MLVTMAASKNVVLCKQYHHHLKFILQMSTQNLSFCKRKEPKVSCMTPVSFTRQHCTMCLRGALQRSSMSRVSSTVSEPHIYVRHCSSKSVLHNQPPSWLHNHHRLNLLHGHVSLRLDLANRLQGPGLEALRHSLVARGGDQGELEHLIKDFSLFAKVEKRKQAWEAQIADVNNKIDLLKAQAGIADSPQEDSPSTKKERFKQEMADFKKKSADPQEPQRPHSAYFLFLADFLASLPKPDIVDKKDFIKRDKKADYKKAHKRWNSMKAEEKKPYIEAASAEAKRYDEKQKMFFSENEEYKHLKRKSNDMQQSSKKDISDFYDLEEVVYKRALKLPNDLHFETPLNEEPVILKEKEGTRAPQSVSHVEAGEMHGLIKFSSIGPRAYFLLGELAIAELALQDLVADFLKRKSYRIFTGPEFYRPQIMEACGRDILNTEEVLTLYCNLPSSRVEPLVHLAGVSDMSLAGYAANLDFSEDFLPFNMYTCGKTYQKSELPGLYGATQSTQVGFYSCVTAAQMDAQFEAMTQHLWTLLSALGFSTRLSLMPASCLRPQEKRRVELQVFAPSLDKHLAIAHVSDLGDHVSRRLSASHRNVHGDEKHRIPIHMISGTAVNITSLLAAWVEHTDLATCGFSL